MRRLLTLLCLLGAPSALSACGSAVATDSYKGASHEVAQVISNLQSHVTAGERAKICSDDLAAEVVSRLGGKSGCEKAVKDQLTQIDSTSLSIESITVAGSGTTATATVKSVFEGKSRSGTVVNLVKQGKDWKIVSLQ